MLKEYNIGMASGFLAQEVYNTRCVLTSIPKLKTIEKHLIVASWSPDHDLVDIIFPELLNLLSCLKHKLISLEDKRVITSCSIPVQAATLS